MNLFRSIATLAAGTALSQLLSYAALPLLTRLYQPSDFGVLAFFVSLAMLLGLLITGRYELAIPIPKDDDEGRDLLRLATTLGLLSSGVIGIVIVAWNALAGSRGDEGGLATWVYWIPVSLVLTSLTQPLSYWFTRAGRFKALSVSRVLQTGFCSGVQLLAGWTGAAGAAGLVGGALMGQAAAAAGLEIASAATERASARIGIPLRRFREIARRHRDFPMFTSGASLFQLGADQLPTLLIPLLFGTAIGGLTALPMRMVQGAVVVVSLSTAQVFYPHAARLERSGGLTQACLTVHRSLVGWGTLPILVVAWIAPELFGFVFGAEWAISGRYFRYFLPWFLPAIPIVALFQVLFVLGKQRHTLWFNGILVVASLTSLAAGAKWSGPNAAILAFSVAGGLVRIAGLEWLLRSAGVASWRGLRVMLLEVLRSAGALVVLAVARALGATPAALIALAVALILAHVIGRLHRSQAQDVSHDRGPALRP